MCVRLCLCTCICVCVCVRQIMVTALVLDQRHTNEKLFSNHVDGNCTLIATVYGQCVWWLIDNYVAIASMLLLLDSNLPIQPDRSLATKQIHIFNQDNTFPYRFSLDSLLCLPHPCTPHAWQTGKALQNDVSQFHSRHFSVHERIIAKARNISNSTKKKNNLQQNMPCHVLHVAHKPFEMN